MHIYACVLWSGGSNFIKAITGMLLTSDISRRKGWADPYGLQHNRMTTSEQLLKKKILIPCKDCPQVLQVEELQLTEGNTGWAAEWACAQIGQDMEACGCQEDKVHAYMCVLVCVFVCMYCILVFA